MTAAQQNKSAIVEPMLEMEDLATLFRRTSRTIRYWRAEGFLPSPDLVHGKTVLWRRSTIDGWIDGGPGVLN